MGTTPKQTRAMRAALLAWYEAGGRALPWRIRPEDRAAGARVDPYAVWLSEIMLQQTTVPHATPYYHRFLERWPTVEALAAAPEAEVMAAWAGLGYYARARNLIACAHAVAAAGGTFPDTLEGLRALPGVGEYTSNAILAAAFGKPASVVDGNVERVLARVFVIETPLPKAKPEIRRRAAALADPDRPGDYAQAIMDLGATVCTPRAPDCPACPLARWCAARAAGSQTRYPVKAAKAERPRRYGVAYVLTCGDGVLLERRPAKGLLGAMPGLPTTEWRAAKWTEAEARAAAPLAVDWRRAGEIEHVFTHFALTLVVMQAQTTIAPPGLEPMADAAASLPTVFRKALAATVVVSDQTKTSS